ncbi:MAG: Rpn family recombination-promoting nuclease/putative transposase [Cyclobacteriaceae bacterium]
MSSKERYINPFTDFGFKKLFGTEFNKELLIDFLNQVLGDRERIQDLTYLNTEHLGNTESDRKAIFDLYCENEQGEKFIIELQNVKQQYFKDRSIFYSTFPIQSQAPKGTDWDYYLKAVYTIGILNFSFPDKSEQERFMREVQLIDKETVEVFYDKLTFIYLEMPKFKKSEDELLSQFDKWLYVLKNLHRLQNRPVKLQEKVFEKLFSEAEIAKLNKEEMSAYEESLKVYRDNKNTMDYAIETAKKEGMVEGASKREVEIARELKKNGVSIDLIEKTTGLTKEQIEKL